MQINFREKERNGCLTFTDVHICHENEKFATNIYKKRSWGLYQLHNFST